MDKYNDIDSLRSFDKHWPGEIYCI